MSDVSMTPARSPQTHFPCTIHRLHVRALLLCRTDLVLCVRLDGRCADGVCVEPEASVFCVCERVRVIACVSM